MKAYLFSIAHRGENNAHTVRLPCADLENRAGTGGTYTCTMKTSAGELIHPDATKVGDTVVITVTDEMTETAGSCYFQVTYTNGDKIARTPIYNGTILAAVNEQ